MLSEPHAVIFPCLGWQALRADTVVPYVTYCALKGLDHKGSGRVAVRAACTLIANWRGIASASAKRVLVSAAKCGYLRIDGDYVYLTSTARLLNQFHLDRERAPHLVLLSLLRKPAAMAAHLYATVYEMPGHTQRFKNGALSRPIKEAITGVPVTTQRRYDRYASELVQPCNARVERPGEPSVALWGEGYYIGRGGTQMKRLADYRVAVGHLRVSRSAATHALRKARLLRDGSEAEGSAGLPVLNSRGFCPTEPEPPARRFFSGASQHDARKRAGDEIDRRGPEPVIAWGRNGRMKFVLVESRA